MSLKLFICMGPLVYFSYWNTWFNCKFLKLFHWNVAVNEFNIPSIKTVVMEICHNKICGVKGLLLWQEILLNTELYKVNV